MNIREKLKYIQEGYTFNEINSDTFAPINFTIKESDQLFMESFSVDIEYLIEMSSGNSFIGHIKTIFQWLRDKIMQFITFIRNKFTRARKGAKETAKNVKDNAHKLEQPHPPTVHVEHKPSVTHEPAVTHHHPEPKHEEPAHEPEHHESEPEYHEPEHEPDHYEPEPEYIEHHGGAMEYRPDDNEIVILSKILSDDNSFDNGYKKMYDAIGGYIERLEKHPADHHQIIADSDVIDSKPFLNRICKQALSVPFNKTDIFKRLYGEPVSKRTTVQELTRLADKLYILDEECEQFADWLQKKLPYELEKIERTFEKYIDKPKGRIITGKTENYDEDKELIETLNYALAKVIKLMNMQMHVIQIFASMHADVFIQLRGELEHYDWVLNPATQDFGDFDNDDGIIH